MQGCIYDGDEIMKNTRLIGVTLIFLTIVLMFVTQCWAFKILIVENDEASPSHGQGMQYCAMATSGLPADDVPILFMTTQGMDWKQVCQYALDNKFDIISRSVSGQSASHSEVAHDILGRTGIACVYSHYTNASVEAPGYIISPDMEPPTASTNYGVEFTNPLAGSSSAAASYTAGMLAKLMMDHPKWNFWDARAALRQTADQYETGVTKERGYGIIDQIAANEVTKLEPFGPWIYAVLLDEGANTVTFKWADFLQSSRQTTVLVKFKNEPKRNSTPDDGEIIYEGDDETYTYVYTQDESVWFAWFTIDVEGNVSYVEPFHKKHLDLDCKREPLTLYLNNEGSNVVQDGRSWETAFTKMSDLSTAVEPGDTVYVKATDTPYRGSFKLYSGNTFYFDAAGAGNLRGAKKAEVRGSELALPGMWEPYGPGTPNTYYYKPTSANGFTNWANQTYLTQGGVWHVDPVTKVVTTFSRGPSKEALSENEMYWDEGEQKVYVNTGGSVPEAGLEVANAAFIAEIESPYNYEHERDVYNGIFRFGENGLGSANIIIWDTSHTISGCSFEYCSRFGVFGMGFHGAPEGALVFTANTFRGNGNDGFFWHWYCDSGSKTASANIYLEANTFVGNGGDGAEIYAQGEGKYPWPVFVYQNTFLRNGGKGLHLSGIEKTYANVTVKNNISYNNQEENFFALDSKNLILTAGYNCNGGGRYGGAWEALKGPGNIESDPLLVDNKGLGYLQSFSPVIGRGDPSVNLVSDHDGNVFDSTPSMGAFEYINDSRWYVDALEGNDENAGDFEHPWRSLSKVNGAKFNPGDAILLMPGYWDETIIFSSSGTSSQPISLSVYGNEGFATMYGGLDFNGQDYINVKRLYFTEKVTMSGNHCSLSFCVVNGSEQDGVVVTGESNLLYNNTIYNSTASGLNIQNDCQVVNTIVYSSKMGDIKISANKVVTGLYNCFKDSKKTGTGFYNDPAFTTLWGKNPLFKNSATGHFDLQINSPCIDKGSNNPGIYFSEAYYPAQNSDDITVINGVFIYDPYFLPLGKGTSFYSQSTTAIRFTNIKVPKDAHIIQAIMAFYSYHEPRCNWKVRITGEESVYSATFSPYDDFKKRKRTSSSVIWSEIFGATPTYGYNFNYTKQVESPSVKDIISEITSLDGWNSGNNLTLFIDDSGSDDSCTLSVYSYNHNGGSMKPELRVTYSTLEIGLSLPEDIRGQTAPQGAGIDIGAYEFVK